MKTVTLVSQLKNNGIKNNLLLNAFQEVSTVFSGLNKELKRMLFIDSTGFIKPRIVIIAKMLDKLDIKKGDKILLIGVDSIYILAALSKIFKEVYVIETNNYYTKWMLDVIQNLELKNIIIKDTDFSNGWQEKEPFDAILIANEIEKLNTNILNQLKIGGQLLAPIGTDWAHVIFEIVERQSKTEFKKRVLRENFFIPNPKVIPKVSTENFPDKEIVNRIKTVAIPFESIEKYPIDSLLERIGDAKVVLLGEASHGTSEFYLTRQKITKALIEKKGFNLVCAEADWSDAEQINNYVRNKDKKMDWMPFTRFPQWMWKNQEVLDFVEWLRNFNVKKNNEVGFYGLDLYGLENSIELVIKYLEKVDVNLANLAKERYSCISPFLADPAIYGKMVVSNKMESCEKEILQMLIDLLKKKNKLDHSPEYFYAYQNANVVVDAEQYYKAMYYGSAESWNLRDFHMFQTLKSLLSYYKKDAKAVVWAHNSHIGNALSTEMYSRGEINIGHLSREYFGEKVYNIGFGTHTGTVAAANNWGEEMQIMNVNPSLKNSYENLCHQVGMDAFSLPLKEQFSNKKMIESLDIPKLERAIGVIYRPQTERMSHYFHALLPSQFDEYIFFDTSQAITPLSNNQDLSKTLLNHPFGFIDS